MSEDDGEPSGEGEDEGGGLCAFDSGPPFSSVASVGIVVCVGRLVMAIMRLAPMANRWRQIKVVKGKQRVLVSWLPVSARSVDD